MGEKDIRSFQLTLESPVGEAINVPVRFPKKTWIYPLSFLRGGMLEKSINANRTEVRHHGLYVYTSQGTMTLFIGDGQYRSFEPHIQFTAYAHKAHKIKMSLS